MHIYFPIMNDPPLIIRNLTPNRFELKSIERFETLPTISNTPILSNVTNVTKNFTSLFSFDAESPIQLHSHLSPSAFAPNAPLFRKPSIMDAKIQRRNAPLRPFNTRNA